MRSFAPFEKSERAKRERVIAQPCIKDSILGSYLSVGYESIQSLGAIYQSVTKVVHPWELIISLLLKYSILRSYIKDSIIGSYLSVCYESIQSLGAIYQSVTKVFLPRELFISLLLKYSILGSYLSVCYDSIQSLRATLFLSVCY